MRTATSLTLVAIGAILAFAVTAHPRWLNLQVAGVVIMLVGLAGLFLNRTGYGWLRRRIVFRRGARGPIVGHIDQTNYPSSYAVIDPAALQSVSPAPDDETGPEPTATIPDVPATDETVTQWVDSDEAPPAKDGTVVEEYIEE
jgi:hypothetical protein